MESWVSCRGPMPGRLLSLLLLIARSSHNRRIARSLRFRGRPPYTGSARRRVPSHGSHTRNCQRCATLPIRQRLEMPCRNHSHTLRNAPLSSPLSRSIAASVSALCEESRSAMYYVLKHAGEKPAHPFRVSHCTERECLFPPGIGLQHDIEVNGQPARSGRCDGFGSGPGG